jgi:hypothetical protein
MPRSGASSPSPSEEDLRRPAILASGRAPHSPSVYMHGISTPLTSPNELDSPTRKKFKYLSPRIGSYFQADVEPFQKISSGPFKEDDTTVASQGSLLGQSSTGTGKKKKAGRPKGGGRTSLKKQGSCCCACACACYSC